jgi:hypothetical protein
MCRIYARAWLPVEVATLLGRELSAVTVRRVAARMTRSFSRVCTEMTILHKKIGRNGQKSLPGGGIYVYRSDKIDLLLIEISKKS